tara:strand:+ start:12053 stop:12283 length:231 start_codon:yes stop_codon:yes gene_type:complete
MTRLKVEGHDSLVRDETNNAIINTDKTAYSVYMKKVIARKQETEKVRGLVREVNELREDMKQIKKLLGKMVENNGR